MASERHEYRSRGSSVHGGYGGETSSTRNRSTGSSFWPFSPFMDVKMRERAKAGWSFCASPGRKMRRGAAGSDRLQFLAGFEAHRFTGRDIHFLTGARIAPDAGLARLDVEHAKAPEFDTLAATEGILQRTKDRFHGLLGLSARHGCLCDD